jgi:hypothetical protein
VNPRLAVVPLVVAGAFGVSYGVSSALDKPEAPAERAPDASTALEGDARAVPLAPPRTVSATSLGAAPALPALRPAPRRRARRTSEPSPPPAATASPTPAPAATADPAPAPVRTAVPRSNPAPAPAPTPRPQRPAPAPEPQEPAGDVFDSTG